MNALKAMMKRPGYSPEQNALAQLLGRQFDTEELNPTAGAGFQGLQYGQGVVQTTNPDGSQNAPTYIDSPDVSRGTNLDYSRPQIEIAGMGKGYYSKDGLSANIGGKNVLLGYDRKASNEENDRLLKRALTQSQVAENNAQIAQMGAKDQVKPIWDAERGVFITPPTAGEGPSVIPVAGLGLKPKASTEDEKKAAGWAIRLENSLKAMDDIGSKYPDAVKPQIGATLASNIPNILGGDMIANSLNSSPRRQVEASQLDALDAALTLATGAAYTKEQLKNLSKSYFPQVGDEQKDIEYKKDLLGKIIQTARIRAGSAESNVDKVINSAPRSNVEQSRAKAEARQAIARGAPQAAVMERLKAMGIESL